MTCIAPDRIAAPRIVVGVGCRAGKSPEAIEAAIAAALARR
ncbi:cobalamin biosynthesis protein CbiG, partial [Burkholderia sp. Ap-962]|nr:cobalamin biosynthesis protein CbiG [Burkholderia sp. Ap-962]